LKAKPALKAKPSPSQTPSPHPVPHRSPSPKGKDNHEDEGNVFAKILVKAAHKKLVALKGNVANVSILSDDTVLSEVHEFIKTGFDEIDHILGGGFAVGRASEVFGPEGSGKSALAHIALRQNQRDGGTPIYIDFESALDPEKMEQLGINPDRLVYCTPSCIEEAWDLIFTFIEALKNNPPPAPTLIVWDSVAASVPKAELDEKTAAQSHIGLVARSMSRGCRKMFRAIAEVRAHMLWINQERQAIGGGPFQELETFGGKAIKYAASQRVRVSRVETLKVSERAIGYRIRCTTRKNRCAPPHQKANWILDFRFGPSPELTLFEFLLDKRAIKKAGGGVYTFAVVEGEPVMRFGKHQWRHLIIENEEMRKAATKKAKEICVELGKSLGTAAVSEDDPEPAEESGA
jgi:recombination protein RecA